MIKKALIILVILSNLLAIKSESLTCGEEQIEHCSKCGNTPNVDECYECEGGHFPLLENLLCIPCDDPIYGQIGCKGNCDSSSYSDSGFAYCEECKPGYYNVEGLCYKCSRGSDECVECTYEKEDNSDEKIFKCTKCSSNEYRINDQYYCEKCEINNCKTCHYPDGSTEPECDLCNYGYYINSEKKCSKCQEYDITGGRCTTCSSDINDKDKTTCYCFSHYTKKDDYSCEECPDNCSKCEYNSATGKTKCLGCYSGYRLNEVNTCTKCSDGCKECYLDENKKSICLRCSSGKRDPNDPDKCLICPDNCQDCEYDTEKNEAKCTKCAYNFVLNPNNEQCVHCNEETVTGLSGCGFCDYNKTSKSYECKSCQYYGEYAYIANQYKCLPNDDNEKAGLYGCINAIYIAETEKYECLLCKSNFIPVITDKSCLGKGAEGLSQFCLEAEKINGKYSCTKCPNNYILINNKDKGINNCYEIKDDFSFCVEGIIENEVNKCTKCVDNAELNSNKCQCKSDSFSKDTYKCYKCTDNNVGNPGCTETDGCTYYPANDQLNCKKCKDGYFEYTTGQCFLCSNELSNCDYCHFDSDENKLMCDSCKNGIYGLNEEKKCGLNDFDEYPDISPGCIISKDKLDEYKKNNKCETCKYGYFKTKDEKCIYCRSEQYGGPACFECGYEEDENGRETENIICKKCYSSNSNNDNHYSFYDLSHNYDFYGSLKVNNDNPLISSKGKCYDCQLEFSESCRKCEFSKKEDGTEKLRCAVCNPSYYLSEEGTCVNYIGLIEKEPNCQRYNFSLANLDLIGYHESIDISNFNYYDSNQNSNFTGFTYNDIKGSIKSVCTLCDYGYVLNENGNCDKLTIKECTFVSIMKHQNDWREACQQLCYWYDSGTLIYMKFEGDNSRELSLNNLNTSYLDYLINQFGESNSPQVCLKATGKGSENFPKNLLNCQEAYYFAENKTYLCKNCFYDYYLDNNTNTCKKIEYKADEYYVDKDNYFNCKIETNETDAYPTYYCHNYMTNSEDLFTLITYESGQHEFKKATGELEGCSQANADTTFINTAYNCTKCYLGYIPYYSRFYKRFICQNMKTSIIRKKEISFDAYKDIQDKMSAKDGICEKDYFFTPDDENCYKCDVEQGMPGCKGACNFSLKRNNIIECTGGCKSGYIESSKGICSSCSAISKGCHECHYESEYPSDFNGIKRKRRFECDFCEEGYSKSSTGECLNCEDLGLDDCDRCEINPKNTSQYICTKCIDNYFINEEGECDYCEKDDFKSITKNKCVDCDDTSEGGIANCDYCSSDGEKAICSACKEDYILLTSNNSCLLRNNELQKFDKCDILAMDKSNKMVCSKCKKQYSMINNECLYIPTLYDELFQIFYLKHYLDIYKEDKSVSAYVDFLRNDYIFKKYVNFSACQEAENKGTEENPLYSCKKCYERIRKKKKDVPFIKITEENTQISYCLDPFDNDAIENCSEAKYKIKDGEEVFNCTKCTQDHELSYNKLTDTFYCQTSQTLIQKCLVLFCKTCNPYDGYLCNECITDYEVNSASGSCVKKTEVVPAVTWKDIYRLNMNDEKVINNKVIKGPSLRMKGITSSQINTGHAFIVYLTFKIKVATRNLEDNEDTITMPAICEVVEGVDASTDDINIVEYVCIGNSTTEEDMTNYKLDNIEEKKEESKPGETVESEIKASNLNELMASMTEEKLENLESKTESTFTYEELNKIVTFTMNEKIDNIKANNYKFNINITGSLNKELDAIVIENEFDLAEVDNKANCKFEIKDDKKTAELTCDLDVSNHKDIKAFSFKTSQVITENNEIYLSKLNDIVLSNTVEEKKNNKSKLLSVSLVYLALLLFMI